MGSKCAYFQGVSRGQPVTLTGFFIFEGQATATDGLVAIGCIQSSCGWIFGPPNRTLKHYLGKVTGDL